MYGVIIFNIYFICFFLHALTQLKSLLNSCIDIFLSSLSGHPLDQACPSVCEDLNLLNICPW